MPKLKPGTVVPTAAEDATITAPAQLDPDAPPYTDEEWAQVKPFGKIPKKDDTQE